MRASCNTALLANPCIFFAHSKPPHRPHIYNIYLYLYAAILNSLRLLMLRPGDGPTFPVFQSPFMNTKDKDPGNGNQG